MLEFDNGTPMREVRGYIHETIREVRRARRDIEELRRMLAESNARIAALEHCRSTDPLVTARLEDAEVVFVDHDRRLEEMELFAD